MNYWLRRAELKEMAQELLDQFRGRIFSSPQQVNAYFNQVKGTVYAKHPKISGSLNVRLQISEKLPGKQYIVSSVSIDEP